MKYSVILPYYKRPELERTLESFVKHYADRNDYEVIIVEDSKNAVDIYSNEDLLRIISAFNDKVTIRHYVDFKVSFNPSSKYNLGVLKAQGEFIVLSSPEIIHESNILGGFDTLLEEDKNSYIVCACKAMRGTEFYMWYQHYLIRNVMFHFCSVMSKENYNKVGGFDEKYCAGIGFDDEDFLSKVINKGIKIIPRDDLVTIHIEHNREYIDQHRDLVEVNRSLFLGSR